MFNDYVETSTLATRLPGWEGHRAYEVGGLDRQVFEGGIGDSFEGQLIPGVTARCLAEFEIKRLWHTYRGLAWAECEAVYEELVKAWREPELFLQMWEHRDTEASRLELLSKLEFSGTLALEPDATPGLEHARVDDVREDGGADASGEVAETPREKLERLEKALDKFDPTETLLALEDFGHVCETQDVVEAYAAGVFSGAAARERVWQAQLDKRVTLAVKTRLATEEGIKRELKDRVASQELQIQSLEEALAALSDPEHTARRQQQARAPGSVTSAELRYVGSVSGLLHPLHSLMHVGLQLRSRSLEQVTTLRAPSFMVGDTMSTVLLGWQRLACEVPELASSRTYFFEGPPRIQTFFGEACSAPGYFVDGALLEHLRDVAGMDLQRGHYVQRTPDGGFRLWAAPEEGMSQRFDDNMAEKAFNGLTERHVASFLQVDYGSAKLPHMARIRQITRALLNKFYSKSKFDSEDGAHNGEATHTDRPFAGHYVRRSADNQKLFMTGMPSPPDLEEFMQAWDERLGAAGWWYNFQAGSAAWGSFATGIGALPTQRVRQSLEYAGLAHHVQPQHGDRAWSRQVHFMKLGNVKAAWDTSLTFNPTVRIDVMSLWEEGEHDPRPAGTLPGYEHFVR